MKFTKSARLCRKADFMRVVRHARRLVGQWVILDVAPSQSPHTRLGITVSRRFGKSHERNRFKRVVREGFRHSQLQLPKRLDINIRPRTQAKWAKPQDISLELLQLLNK